MTSDIEKSNWVRVIEAGMLPPGTGHRFAYQGEDIAIFNTGDEFYAIGDTCTHAEASLTDGDFYEDMRGWVAECPLHGSQFDVTTGEAVSLPATGNSGKYALKVEDGIIYINPEPVTPRKE
ncbi:MAG TPA: non-heme iron oxygenase ferredoxin subunit [Chloroflexia bacterium]|jgi:nitrite reductase/ring-hydroxylating ferredoxin subunit